jgi:Interleukin-like EMT inducer
LSRIRARRGYTQGGRDLTRLRHGALVILFYLAVAAIYTYPLVFELSTAVLRGGGGDYQMETSIVAWNARQILHDPLGIHDLPFYYPYSHTVAYQQPEFFTGLLAAPLLALGATPLFVVNLFAVAAIVGGGAFTYLLAHSITGRALPSLLAGMVYGFFTNRMDHLGQFTYQMAAFSPLILWTLHRVLRDARWRDLAVFGTALWAQTLSGLYQTFGLVFALGGFAAAYLLLRPSALTRRLVVRGVLILALLAIALAPFLWPYVAHRQELGLRRDVSESEWYGMDLLSLFDPGIFNTLYGKRLLFLDRSEGGLFPGFAALGLAAVALGTLAAASPTGSPRWIRRTQRSLTATAALCLIVVALAATGGLDFRTGILRHLSVHTLTWPVNVLPALALAAVALEGRRRRAGPLITREWILVSLFLTVLTYLLTLAPTLKIAEHQWGTAPFRWLYANVPGAAAFRAPGRWSLAFALPLALLVALGASALADRLPRWRGAALGALLVTMVMELNVFPLPWTRIPPIPPIYAWLATQPGDFAVLELPIAEEGVDAWAMFWAANAHWPTLVNGGGGFLLATVAELVAELRPVFNPRRFAQAVRQIVPLRYVVVHRDKFQLAEQLREERPPGFRLVGPIGLDDVYELTDTPDTAIELHRDFSSRFVRAHPMAELTLRFDGDDPDVVRWVEVRLNGRPLSRIDTAGATTLALAPPFRAADRNELRLVHRYEVKPDLVRSVEAYRIGTTGVRSPVDIEVVSEGRGPQGQGGLVSVIVNGHEVVDLPRRGHNVVALDGGDGHVLWSDNFDTFRSQAESRRMAERIGGLPPGVIVIVGVKTDGGGQLTPEGVAALRSVGGQRDLQRTLWLAHALIGVKGAQPGSAVENAGPGRVAVSVGRSRSLSFTLETFALR